MYGEDVFGCKIRVGLAPSRPSAGESRRKATLEKLGALRYTNGKIGRRQGSGSRSPQTRGCKRCEAGERSPSSDRYTSPRNNKQSQERALNNSPHRPLNNSPRRPLNNTPHRTLSNSPHRPNNSPQRHLSNSPQRHLSNSPHRQLSNSPHRHLSNSPLRNGHTHHPTHTQPDRPPSDTHNNTSPPSPRVSSVPPATLDIPPALQDPFNANHTQDSGVAADPRPSRRARRRRRRPRMRSEGECEGQSPGVATRNTLSKQQGTWSSIIHVVE